MYKNIRQSYTEVSCAPLINFYPINAKLPREAASKTKDQHMVVKTQTIEKDKT